MKLETPWAGAAAARVTAARWLVALAAVLACGPDAEGPAADAPRAGRAAAPIAFVADGDCAGCHPEPARAWRGSHHDLAMQPANASTVLGDFDDATFARFPALTRFSRRGDRYFVHTEGPDGRSAEFAVKYTFGVEPLQQYLIELPGGRLQALTLAWDTEGQRWFDLYEGEQIPAGDPLHWTGALQNWNAMCADCHSTGLRRGYDADRDAYDTSWVEIDVGCQACHGPGAAHVAWARDAEPQRPAPPDDERDDERGLVVDFSGGDARLEVEACAPCHARRHAVSASYQHGRPLLDDYVPELLRPDLYHADGQIDGEVYVYGSFVQSRMYARGVRCSDCHEPHALSLRVEGDALCTRCHGVTPDPRFPTLTAKTYDVPAHHHHPEAATGARCVACHMPAKTYMGVDPRRDHSFRVPRPDLTARIGTPNACNGCHADRSPDWAAQQVTGWFGSERTSVPDPAEAIAAARAGASEAIPGLVELSADENAPAILRATALDLLRGAGPAGLAPALAATRDADPLVRTAAVSPLELLPHSARLEALGPLLDDPIRAVRNEAARALAAVPRDAFDPDLRRAFDAALADFEAAQLAQADQPAAHLNLAVVAAARGETERALAAYRTALRLDPGFVPARVNLANLYNALGRNADAERELRAALAMAPEQGELHYSLGLLLAEERRFEEAETALARAAELMPGRPRVRYNRGLALQRLGRAEAAETELLAAHAIAPGDPEILYAVVVLLVQTERFDRALPYALQLVELAPGAPGPQQLLERVRSGANPPADAPR